MSHRLSIRARLYCIFWPGHRFHGGIDSLRLSRASSGFAQALRPVRLGLAAAAEPPRNEIDSLHVQLSTVLNAAIDGLIMIDDRGIIQSFNPAAARMFSYAPEEAIGQNVNMLMPEPHRSAHDRYISDYLTTGRARIVGIKGREVGARRKDGTVFPIDLVISEMWINGTLMFLGTARDITSRKEEETEKEQKFITELTRSNAELAQFAYVASHDLQEPLRMVASYLGLLSRRYQGKLDAEADEFIGYAVDGAERMKLLINDLLGYSRVSNAPLNLETVNTGFAANAVVKVLADRTKESGAEITIESLPEVRADPVMIERLFINLVDNALKYRSSSPPRIRIASERKDNFWKFSMTDNGIGIDPKFVRKVFEIFTRLHSREKYPGTGIGLASCKRIVERHGGEIWVEPAPGGGSIFFFTLPA